MTTWNYRLVRVKYARTGTSHVEVREVYYDEEGTPYMVTDRGIFAKGETKAEVRRDLTRMQAALRKPVLNYQDIVNGRKRKRK